MSYKPINMLTVDLEDWPQSTLDHSLPISSRVVDNTHRLLDIFAQHNTRATFFVLGLVVEKYPQLVRDVADAGHEIASHGYGHREIFLQTQEAFREDLQRSLHILQDLIGKPVLGYRAPDFSVIPKTIWALDIMQELGLKYDSSIFPFQGSRYGIASAPREIHEIRPGLLEIPLSTLQIRSRRIPVAGGGYFRVLPYWLNRTAIRQIQQEQPVIVYLHPYEIDAKELAEIDHAVPWKLRLSQGLNRRSVAGKVARLLTDFRFSSVKEILNLE